MFNSAIERAKAIASKMSQQAGGEGGGSPGPNAGVEFRGGGGGGGGGRPGFGSPPMQQSRKRERDDDQGGNYQQGGLYNQSQQRYSQQPPPQQQFQQQQQQFRPPQFQPPQQHHQGPPAFQQQQLPFQQQQQFQLQAFQAASAMMSPFQAQQQQPMQMQGGGVPTGPQRTLTGAYEELEIKIPPQMLPLVLGRAGERLKGIEMACSVIVQIAPKSTDPAAPRIATIKGADSGVESARAKIDDIVNGSGSLVALMGATRPPPMLNNQMAMGGGEMGMSRGHQGDRGGMGPRMGEQTVYVQVSSTRVGLVIGRGGEVIKALQEKTGARINVVKEDDKGPMRTIVVTGTPNQIAHAQREIDDIVNNVNHGGVERYTVGGITEQVKVAKDKIGLVIGKGGEAIKEIQRECHVKLNVEQFNDPDGDRIVTVTGTAEAIANAKDLINEKTGMNKRFTAGGPENGELGAVFDSSYARVDPAYAAAYGSGKAINIPKSTQPGPVEYAEQYKQYYESLGYTFPADFDVTEYLVSMIADQQTQEQMKQLPQGQGAPTGPH